MLTITEIYQRWLNARPALDRIDFVNTWRRPDGEPRKFSELREGSPYTGFVETILPTPRMESLP